MWKGIFGAFIAHWDRCCPGNGAVFIFCIYDSWSSSCFDVFSLNSSWKDRRECETQTFITGYCLNLFCEGQTKCSNRSMLFLWSYSSRFPVTKHRDPVTLGETVQTRTSSHIHTPSPCVTGLIISSLAARGAEWFQVSIPEPPLGSRIRSQKIARDTEG